jgi:hypothetical protein
MTDKITVKEKLSEIEREIAIRERLYPNWITAGKIPAARAHKQIEILKAIAQDYRERLE